MATVSFIDLFSDGAERYAVARPRYPDQLIEFVARSSPALDTAWDCGTGNGQAAVDLARHFRQVWATDPSPAQIDHAIPSDRVIYSVQPAEQVDFPDKSVDAVTVAQALHWFNQGQFFAEARRVLKPGGLFCSWGYSWSQVTPAIDEILKATVLQTLAPYWAPQNRALWNGYRGVEMPFRPVAPPNVEIRVRWTLLEYMAYVYTWSATRQAIAAVGPEFFEAACQRMELAWEGKDRVREVTMPLSVIAGVAV